MNKINLMGNKSPHRKDKVANPMFAKAGTKAKAINLKASTKAPKQPQLSDKDTADAQAEYKATIKTIAINKELMEDNISNILSTIPITERIVNLVDKQTNLIPTSSILLTVISKYSHHNSEYRAAVNYRGNDITPNLYTFIILKSGYGKDLSNNKVAELFDKVDTAKYFYTKEQYQKIDQHIALNTTEDKEYPGYIPIIPDSEYNMAKSTFEGFHSTMLDMNCINYGNILVKSSEFFDTIINSKSSAEQIEFVKDCYYNGAKIGKTIKSREFKSPTTKSPAICASFHSAMELNEFNKQRVIDFAKNGLGRRLLVSMSTQYRYNKQTNTTDINYDKEIEILQNDLAKINEGHEHIHKRLTVDYNTAYFSNQQYSYQYKFSQKAQLFLIELNNFYLDKLEYQNDETHIVVLEQVIKIALNLHLIEYESYIIDKDIVEIAFTLFTLFHVSKTKYETKLFSDDIVDAIEVLYNNKLGKTEFFIKHLKKTNWPAQKKNNFMNDLDEACHEEDKMLQITKDGNKTMYEVVDYSINQTTVTEQESRLKQKAQELSRMEGSFEQDPAELDM